MTARARAEAGGVRVYTAAEDAVIARYFRTKTLKWIAGKLGRAPMSVVAHSHVLEKRGVVKAELRFTRRSWTQAQDDELRGIWGWKAPEVCAAMLHRSQNAVVLRAKRLGLLRTWKGRYCAREVGRIFDMDSKGVAIWIERGYLAGRKCSTGAGQSMRWEITHEAVEAFIRDYPERYVLERISEPYWRRLANEGARDRVWVTVPDAARVLRVNPETVLRHLRRGWLPGERIPWAGGQAWRIRRADLATFQRRAPRVEGLRYVKGRSGALPKRRKVAA